MALRNNTSKSRSLLKGIKDNPRKKLLNGTIIFLLVLVAVWQLKMAFLAQLAFTSSRHQSTIMLYQTDPDILARLAREEHMGHANLDKALFLYKRALQNFVLHVPSWLGLTELYYDRNDEKKAIAALDFANRISRNNTDAAWTKAILADSLDQEDILLSNLLWLAEKQPAKRKEIFALADLNWGDPLIVLQKFGKPYYLDILDFYIKANELEKSKTVWREIVKNSLNNKTNSLAYINYLLRNNEFDSAVQAWQITYNKDNTFIYNGNFEQPLTGSAFGWRITGAKGVSSKKAGYSGGLEVSFDGSENVAFQLAQTIPLPPGDYQFSSSVETDELTTDQRPFWTISGHKCQGLDMQDEMVPITHHPETYVLHFTVPQGCKAIQIALKRNKSFNLDNKIAGSITVGKLALASLSAPSPPPVQPDQEKKDTNSGQLSQEDTEIPVAVPEDHKSTQADEVSSSAPAADQTEQPEAAVPSGSQFQPAAEPTAHAPPDSAAEPPGEAPVSQGLRDIPEPETKPEKIKNEQKLKPEPESDSQPAVQPAPKSEREPMPRKRASITINKLIIRP